MDTYQDTIIAQNKKLAETLKAKLTIEEIRGLYDLFNVDGSVRITMQNGVEAMTPLGYKGPSLQSGASIELYAMDKYARDVMQSYVRAVINEIINPQKEEKKEKKKEIK